MIRPGPLLPVILSLTLAAGPTLGQAAGFGRAQDIKEPVEVTADSLTVDQKTGQATFSGNVLIGQGAMRLSADSVTVTYAQGDQRRISALHAQGNVTLASGEDAAEAQAADYDVETGTIVLTGDVLLSQGGNLLAGDKVTVNLESGTADASGRVRSVLQPEN
ncbi:MULTISPECIES: lipopolysaccharide transport periplasmic protein LptA [Paracoccus]|uniref:lipopolysaccharide transport periplasmic protein LptA n=1 Tax=Paracoccus TaxID=265 RepID=UPI001FB71D12|nr:MULTISPECIES: lipopolysaccharide transport periplasmic protein LptA [Paracoccus]MCJ1900798.1 lipopolysaccharide transport periplasmic protein LptA [Paracoccus versutus]MDF3906055.1 lipopolysaccharide transport periplasmic protein LptA [Paracoccus sp. AS002]